jgi:hypothetical protein
MLETPLRLASVLLCAFALIGFALFAIDETKAASSDSASEVAGRDAGVAVDPSPEDERARERANGTLREAIDDVNDVTLAPFAGIVGDDADRWVRRGVPLVLALALYGVGLGMLARFSRGRA